MSLVDKARVLLNGRKEDDQLISAMALPFHELVLAVMH